MISESVEGQESLREFLSFVFVFVSLHIIELLPPEDVGNIAEPRKLCVCVGFVSVCYQNLLFLTTIGIRAKIGISDLCKSGRN